MSRLRRGKLMKSYEQRHTILERRLATAQARREKAFETAAQALNRLADAEEAEARARIALTNLNLKQRDSNQ